MRLKIIPETISIRTSGMIVNENITWMSDPEASRSLIGIQKTHRSHSLHDEVIFDVVVGFNSILNEDGMTLNFISNIVFNSQVMSSVKGKQSIVSLMGCQTLSIRVVNCTDHVEMDSISSNFESLSSVMELNLR